MARYIASVQLMQLTVYFVASYSYIASNYVLHHKQLASYAFDPIVLQLLVQLHRLNDQIATWLATKQNILVYNMSIHENRLVSQLVNTLNFIGQLQPLSQLVAEQLARQLVSYLSTCDDLFQTHPYSQMKQLYIGI